MTIERQGFMPMAFFKKEAFTGSVKGMRYRMKKEEDTFDVAVYPEPYCYDATPEEQKTRASFPFTEEGRLAAIDWMNEQYESRKAEWDAVARR